MDTLPIEFEEYIKINEKITELEEKRSELKRKMIDVFDNYSVKEWPSPKGIFYLKSRTIYQYSDNMKEMEKRVAQLKKQEIANGTAIIKSAIQYPIFIPIATLNKMRAGMDKIK